MAKDIDLVFKPLKKGDEIRAAYLYEDGRLVVTFERRTELGEQQYAKVLGSAGIARLQFQGRIVFHSGAGVALLRMALKAGLRRVSADLLSPSHGSDNTKRLGLAVGSVTFETDLGTYSDYNIGDLLHTGLTYDQYQTLQRDPAPGFNDTTWSGSPIVARYGFPAESGAPA